MRSPEAFLRFFAKALLNQVGFGVAGEFTVEVLPDLARDLWAWWAQGKTEGQLRAEVQQVAQLSPDDAEQQAGRLAAELAGDRPEAVRRQVADLVGLVPQAVRASQRRSSDPSGRTVVPGLRLREPRDLLPLLPQRLLRFRPGQRVPARPDWVLEELLGTGGFGEVWRARNPHTGEEAAFKFCVDERAARTLINEAKLLCRVREVGSHPGIVRLRDTHLGASPPCLEYEYVAGGDLTGLIREHPAGVGVRRAAGLILELGEVVAFAHGRGIVHRDLKPANVLREGTGGSARLRVADFGIGEVVSKVIVGHQQTTGPRPGDLTTSLRGAYTPLYASPQQILGKPADPRDDVHALGVIWFQLVTGNLELLALPADWRQEVGERGMPVGQAALLERCLAGKPERRLADAGGARGRVEGAGAASARGRVAAGSARGAAGDRGRDARAGRLGGAGRPKGGGAYSDPVAQAPRGAATW